MPIKFKLRNLDMDEVSLVDAGDNPYARVMLVKRVGESPLAQEEPVEAHFDEGTMFIKTASEKVYQSDSFSFDEENEEWKVDDAELVVDLEEEEEGEAGVELFSLEADDTLLKRAMRRVAEVIYGAVEDDIAKGHFSEVLERRARGEMAEQAYREMSDYCDIMRGAIDMGIFDGEDASQLKETVSEFAETMNKAIDKWVEGSTLNKSVESDLLDHARKRDEEVFGEDLRDEGDEDVDAGVTETTQLEKRIQAGQKEGVDDVAGIDRTKLSKSEREYLDQVEQENEQLRQSGGEVEEVDEGGAAAQEPAEGGGTGVEPDSVTGDTGEHKAPWEVEKMLSKVSDEATREVMRAILMENQQLRKGDEERVFVEKARAFTALPVSPTEVGAVLHRVAKGQTTASDEEFIVETLRSANEIAKSGSALFTHVGDAPAATPGSAVAEVMAKAREVATRDGVSEELAMAKVRRENPELARRYSEEVG